MLPAEEWTLAHMLISPSVDASDHPSRGLYGCSRQYMAIHVSVIFHVVALILASEIIGVYGAWPITGSMEK
jgi:hypothetical protein